MKPRSTKYLYVRPETKQRLEGIMGTIGTVDTWLDKMMNLWEKEHPPKSDLSKVKRL